MRARGVSAAAVLLVVGLGCEERKPTTTNRNETPEPGASPWFEDRTAASGIDFLHTSGKKRFWYPEIFAGGVLLLDYDRDGLLDVYLVQGGEIAPEGGDSPGNRLYRNLGDFRFQDVTEAAGVGDRGYGMGAPLRTTTATETPTSTSPTRANVLYRNEGNGRFTDVTADAGVGDVNWSTSSLFFDADADGDLDLYVADYLRWSIATDVECYSGSGRRVYCNPNNFQASQPDALYRNDGNGRFTDISAAAGIQEARGNGLGVVAGDFGGDGRIDLYVANDGMANQLWINQGGLKFVDEGLSTGTAFNAVGEAEAGMGIAAADVDSDGDLDLFVSHLREETNTFYLRDTDRFFEDITNRTGLGSTSYEFTGFGLGIIDFDHDGLLDIYVANGRVNYWDPVNDPEDIYAESNQLFRGVGALRFAEVQPRGGTARPIVETSRAAAFGDLDNDGAVDVVVGNRDAKATVLRNTIGSGGHWVQFAVRDRDGGYALHARVRIDAGGVPRWRRVERGYSYCASNDPRVHCGLGSATTVDAVTVYWNDGATSEFGPFEVDRVHVLQRNQ